MKAIMYHYVRFGDPEFPQLRYLHFDDFRKQLDYFQTESHIVKQPEFLDALKTGKARQDGIVLTFDDGFIDHVKFVLPELKRRDLWAIFYVPTAIFQGKELIAVHRIHALLGAFGGETILNELLRILSNEQLSPEHKETFHASTYRSQVNDDKTTLVKQILNYYINYAYRKKILDTLMRKFFPNEKELVEKWYLSCRDLRELHDQGMLVGSHTTSHKVLSRLSIDEQRTEIATSFTQLEEIVGRLPVRTFCYPYGGSNTFSPETGKILEDCDCIFSFGVEPRDILQHDLTNRRQALPRYDCNMFPYGRAR